jgi:hypothetical protein
MSLKNTIYDYIKSQYPKVVHKGEIGRKAVLEWGYENENAGRRCRELVDSKQVRAVYNDKHEVMYQWIPNTSICCYSFGKFSVHGIDCPMRKVETVSGSSQLSF